MKTIIAALTLFVCAQASATEVKPLVSISSANMLSGTVQTITLKDNGLVYVQESSYIDETSTKERPFARVQSEEQLANILNAIALVPADAQTTKENFEDCAYDSAYSVQVYDSKFADGSLTVKVGDCSGGTQVVGKNAQWAQALVRLIESAYDVL